jgi:GNAT superfamily N-acetyltransferase
VLFGASMDALGPQPKCGSVAVMNIRPRCDADIGRCADLLATVHVIDGYPVRMPTEPATFLCPPDLLGAWVAEDNDCIDGHVALRCRTSAPVLQLASEVTGVDASRLAVVARLFVSPRARRRGIGRALLSAAAARACELGRLPVLDVVDGGKGAVALYEAAGWRRVGEVRVSFSDGQVVDELVYVAPPTTPLA